MSESRRYRNLIESARKTDPPYCAVAHPCDASSLEAVVEAARLGLFRPILLGPRARIRAVARENGFDISDMELISTAHSHASAERAVECVQSAQASLLMKGSLHTDELLHAILKHNGGLRTERRLSHVFVMDVPRYDELLFITDAAVNIFPDLEIKADIVRNAIDLHLGLGLGTPRVAIVSAVEQVTSKIPNTLVAAALCKMADRGQIVGGLIDGPLALDNAISPEAARVKGIESEEAGRAQILVVPDMEAGNMLAKNLTFLAGASAAGVVLGARVPIVLTSRADNQRTKLASCAVASLYADHLARQVLAQAAGGGE